MASKKQKAFILFDKGYTRDDPKVKDVVPNYQYRRNLWDMWAESRGVAPEVTTEESESVAEVATPDSEGAIETPEGRGEAA